MITMRPSRERGHSQLGWLDSRHSFAFGAYRDAAHLGFRSLRVINEDRVAPGGGFPPHSHRDMEILTYVLDGALAHQDSLGNGSVIYPGEVQIMSAGTGITHSEYNHSKVDPAHFLQIWFLPGTEGIAPRYQQQPIAPATGAKPLQLVGARDGRGGAVLINQDVDLYAATLPAGATARHVLGPGRHAWIQVAHGTLRVNGKTLSAGDGAALSGEPAVDLAADGAAEALLFDLA